MEQEYNIKEYRMDGLQIGTFLFKYREIMNDEENEVKEVELDVYKINGPILLYMKTYRAPYLEEATAESMSEALYEEFFVMHEDETEEN
nr:hypothetical protein [uncultured Peptostreptococcus sp.]